MEKATKTKHHMTKLDKERRRAGLLFLVPSIALCLVFVLIPLFNAVSYSFTDWDGLTVNQETGEAIYNNVGFQNYLGIPKIEGFSDMMIATVTFAIGTTLLTVFVAFLTALALDKRGRGHIPRGFLRALWFLPALLSGSVVGILWRVMYNYNLGVINKILGAIGAAPVNWLETYGVTNIAIIIGASWVQIGFCVVIFLAGLQSIPLDLYEAASIDGARSRQNLLHITLPMMAPSITINVITTTIAGFKAYELPYLISNGLPGKSTLLMTQRIFFFGFEANDYGKGSALAVLLMLIIAAISLIQLIYLRKREDIY